MRFGNGVPVHPILRGNPALDQGDPALGIDVDQRGEPRAVPDIGAFEATSGAVTGRLFLDFDRDQLQGRTEVGIAGPTVVARSSEGVSLVIAQEDNLLTPQVDETGQFLLDGLESGNYLISVEGFSNWSVSTPELAVFPQQALEPDKRIEGSRISANGEFVAFHTDATNILPEDAEDDSDIYLFERSTGTTTLVTKQGDGQVFEISGDGRTILYGNAFFGFFNELYAYDVVADRRHDIHSWGSYSDREYREIGMTPDGRFAIYIASDDKLTFRDFRGNQSFKSENFLPADLESSTYAGYSSNGPEFFFTGSFLDASQQRFVAVYAHDLASGTTEMLYSEAATAGEEISDVRVSPSADSITFIPPSTGTTVVLDRESGVTRSDSLIGPPGDPLATSLNGRYVAAKTLDFDDDPAIEVRDRVTGESIIVDVPLPPAYSYSQSPVTMNSDGRFIVVSRYILANPFNPGIGVDVEFGDLITGFDVGLVPDPGTISGSVFEDIAPNSNRDAGEPPIEGWRVFLDLNQNGLLDTGERFETTDAEGRYRFERTDAFQDYSVRIEVGEGYALASPGMQSDFSWQIFLPAGGAITDRDFAVRRVVNTPQSTNSSVSGRIFDDANGNESYDVGIDQPHADVAVYLDSNNDRQHNPGTNEPITRTDADGSYLFEGLGSRIVSVSTILDSGTVHASPLGNSYSLETYPLFPGVQPFGNPQSIDVADFNGDGFQDVAVLLGERNPNRHSVE